MRLGSPHAGMAPPSASSSFSWFSKRVGRNTAGTAGAPELQRTHTHTHSPHSGDESERGKRKTIRSAADATSLWHPTR